MPSSLLSATGRALRRAWWLLDVGRRALLNLLLLMVLASLAWALLRAGPPSLQDKTALVLDLSGHITEQRPGAGRSSALARLQGDPSDGIRLRDLLAVLDAAGRDPHITQALLALDGFAGAGLPTLKEVAAALERFKATGKPVYAWSPSFDQRQYLLAAHATQVWLHPMGEVSVEGYGRYRSYYKDLLDRVGVTANVVRAGTFKNAYESFAANAASPETQSSDGALYRALWGNWTHDVESARKLRPGSVAQAIDSLPASLVAAEGDGARWALEHRWVDALKTRDEMREALTASGARDDVEKTFRQIHWTAYLNQLKPNTGGDAVGVIVAEGSIGDGNAAPGNIGGRSTGELIRKAREDDKIKAVVLRVNSPGGSAFGSELVRRELELTRKLKPVVVSMGDVAASGGYWIATASDEIIADEATITGSIGVIAMLPTAQGTLDKLGVHTDGVTTTWLAGAHDPRRSLDPRFAQLVQASIDHVYRDFIVRAAQARKTSPEKIDAVGQGRVWSGKDALANGLVDRLGSYGDALASAAQRAKLPEGYRVEFVEAAPGRLDRLLQGLGVDADAQARITAGIAQRLGAADAPLQQLKQLQSAAIALGIAAPATSALLQDLGWLTELGDARAAGKPYTAVAHCLCSPP
jgi:protease-4